MKKFLIALVFMSATVAHAQSIGIGTLSPNPKAALDISSTDKGLLIPRMDSATRVAITSPPDGLMVFQTDQRKGFWYAIGSTWMYIPDKTASGDNLGNHQASDNLVLNDKDILLRFATDFNHRLGWFGTGKLWNGQNVDGPVLAGHLGGALGTTFGGIKTALSWNSSQRVGINNTTPQQTLDVGGTARAEQFVYTTPQVHKLIIPVDAFQSVRPDLYHSRLVSQLVTSNDVATFDLTLTGGTAGQAGYVSAPLFLPTGATITNVELIARDNDGTSVSPYITVSNAKPNVGTGIGALSFYIGTGLTVESANFQSASVASTHTIHPDYSYKVIVRLNQNSLNTVLGMVIITYTVANP